MSSGLAEVEGAYGPASSETPTRLPLRPDAVLDRYPLAQMTSARSIRRPRGDVGRIEFSIDGKRKSFTSDRPEASELAKMLPH